MSMPGLRRLDHVGLTVPDLDEAHAFLVDVLGCEYLYSLGPFSDDGTWMADHLGVHPRAVVPENRFYRLGGQAVLEVFRYEAARPAHRSPAQQRRRRAPPRALRGRPRRRRGAPSSHGVTVQAGPTASRGPHEGQRWIYFLAPWGLQLELVSYPGGRRWYLDEAAARQTGPGA